jgi:uncharacterized BrkB/YihY/UPF0761 family membrane protein
MNKQDVSVSTIFFTYFSFGTVAGILFALLVMAVSSIYITHHDEPITISSSYK